MQQPVMETGFWNRTKKVLNCLPQSEHLKWNKTEQENVIPPTLLKRGKKQPPKPKNPANKTPQTNCKTKKPIHAYSQEKPQVKPGWGTATPAAHQPTLFTCQVPVPGASWLMLGKDQRGAKMA